MPPVPRCSRSRCRNPGVRADCAAFRDPSGNLVRIAAGLIGVRPAERMHLYDSSGGPKGQVVIPKELRDELGIEPGDTVTFRRHDDHVAVRQRAVWHCEDDSAVGFA